jgi:zinc protease
MSFTGPEKFSRERQHRLDSVSEALSIRLREVLREDLGGTYTVGVDGDLIRWPIGLARTNVNFTCAPDNIAKLSDAVKSEIQAAKTRGFGPDYLTKVKAAQRRSLEVSVRTNGYWAGWLTEHYRAGTDPKAILDEPKLIESLDGPALQEAARRHFDDRQKMMGVLKPAAAEGPPKAARRTTRQRARLAARTLPPRARGLMLREHSRSSQRQEGGTP